MTDLQQNRYDQLLRRVGDLKGPGSKVNDVLTELFPILDVENLPGELLLLSGSRMCMGRMAQSAGGAGMFSTVFLRLAGGSGMIAQVLLIACELGTNGSIVIGPSTNSSVSGGATAFADGRIFGQGPTGDLQGNNNNLAQGSTFLTLPLVAGTGIVFEPPKGIMTITPGTALSVGSQSANVTLVANFIWIERVAQPSELNL